MFQRHPQNPIITAGLYPWRMAVTFNPGVLYEDGKFFLYERAAGSLRPFHCYIGMLQSDDGVHFRHVSAEPVFTPEMAGSKYGSVQDPRVVKLDDRYYMTYAFRPYTWSLNPTGVGIPEGHETPFPGFDGNSAHNQTRSGIAVSTDRIHWQHLSWVSAPELDDRDVILFPEKIAGRYAALRRPRPFVDPNLKVSDHPGIWLSYSDDLITWDPPVFVMEGIYPWEGNRIGGSTPPIRTEAGWLTFYHGVETLDPTLRRVCYRMGAALLDLNDPTRVLARTPHWIMEPEAYYERFGAFIPNVIFPTGIVVLEGIIHLYYGACDTCICLATARLDDVLEHIITTATEAVQSC